MGDLIRPDRAMLDLIGIVTSTVASPTTKRVYARELGLFLQWAEGYGEGLSRGTVMAYRESMQEAGRGPVSINLALTAIRRLAQEAADRGLMDPTLAGRVESVKGVQRRGSKLHNWLTKDQVRELVTCDSPTTPNRGLRDRAAVLVMGLCGTRREETAQLRFGQLQMRDGRWLFVDVLGKGNKLRQVPAHELAVAAIRAWCGAAGITDREALLFPAVRNPDRITTLPSSGARLYDACIRYCRARQMDFRPHDLRRTFAVLSKKGGADYEEIRQALGHSSITTTEVYLREPMALEHTAVDRIKL